MLTRLDSYAKTLSGAEKRAADYAHRNAERVVYQSVHAVSRAAGVSAATVCRMARRIGCSSFQEFKIRVAREISLPMSAIYGAISARDTDEEVVQKVFGGNVKSIQDTLKILNIEKLSAAARIIATSARVVAFGMGSSGNAAHEIALRLAHLGLRAESYNDSYQMILKAALMRKNETAIGVSHSGRAIAAVEALKLAGKNGATTIGISNYPRSPLRDASALFFYTSFAESGVTATALSSLASQICVIDALYVLVARHLKTAPNFKRLNALIEKTIRTPGKR